MPVISRPATNEQMWQALQMRRPAGPSAGGGTGDAWPRPCPDRLAWLPGPIQDTLARRHSVRGFAAEPVPAATVRAATAAAHAAEAAIWPPGQHGRSGFRFLAAAFSVSGLATGLYACARPDGELHRVDFAGLDMLREQYAPAPVLLLVCGNLNQACRTAGASGYASMLVRAGTAGYGAWLWAIANGLAGTVFGGASHQVSGAARQVDADLCHLFTVAIGRPRPPRPGSGTEGPA